MSTNSTMQGFYENPNPQQVGMMTHHANLPKAGTPLTALVAHGKVKKNAGASAPHSAKTTRPLNSWMAFRSHYSVLFTHLQQKDISGFLTFLWQTDPFKAKWSILAKAYSVIRDHEGKEKAPLDGFLSINANFIGIIEPGSYLVMLGWQIAADGDGQIVLRREFEVNVNSLDVHLLTTNASVNDVVRNSYLHGYITGAGPAVAPNGHGATLTMATSTQPFPRVEQSVSVGSTKEDDLKDTEGQALNDESGENTQKEMHDAPLSPLNIVMERFRHIPQLPVLVREGIDPEWKSKGLPDPALDPPVSTLTNAAYHLDGEYPFVSAFDLVMPSLPFDPFMGNRFNTFDMSDWVKDDEL